MGNQQPRRQGSTEPKRVKRNGNSIKGLHMLGSFDATKTIFKYLDAYKVLQMQALNKWTYEIVVPRC